MTARGSIESYLLAASLGAVDYLNKPVVSREFSTIVQSALAQLGPAGAFLDAA